jgi:hypothetical protein
MLGEELPQYERKLYSEWSFYHIELRIGEEAALQTVTVLIDIC